MTAAGCSLPGCRCGGAYVHFCPECNAAPCWCQDKETARGKVTGEDFALTPPPSLSPGVGGGEGRSELRAELQRRLEKRLEEQRSRRPADPPPRYDEVFEAGTSALNDDLGPPVAPPASGEGDAVAVAIENCEGCQLDDCPTPNECLHYGCPNRPPAPPSPSGRGEEVGAPAAENAPAPNCPATPPATTSGASDLQRTMAALCFDGDSCDREDCPEHNPPATIPLSAVAGALGLDTSAWNGSADDALAAIRARCSLTADLATALDMPAGATREDVIALAAERTRTAGILERARGEAQRAADEARKDLSAARERERQLTEEIAHVRAEADRWLTELRAQPDRVRIAERAEVLGRVAGLARQHAHFHTGVMEHVSQDPEEGDTYRDHSAQRDALTCLIAALAREFGDAWPAGEGK